MDRWRCPDCEFFALGPALAVRHQRDSGHGKPFSEPVRRVYIFWQPHCKQVFLGHAETFARLYLTLTHDSFQFSLGVGPVVNTLDLTLTGARRLLRKLYRS